MKHLATILAFVLLLVGTNEAWAQDQEYPYPTTPLLFGFESVEAQDAFFNNNYGGDPLEGRDYPRFGFDVLSSIGEAPTQGSDAIVVDYATYAPNDWGGSQGLVHGLPEGSAHYDISDFTHIELDYYVFQPADPPVTFRLKLHDKSQGLEGDGSSNVEDWNSEFGDIFQATPGWNTLSIPLEDLGLPGGSVPAGGFSRPGCSTGGVPSEASGCWSGILGNEKLDFDKISGLSFEFFSGTGVQDEDSSASGIIAFDNMRVSGVRYDLLSSFDTAPGGWNNGGGTSDRVVTQDDFIEGTGAMDFTYNVLGGEGWGGSADVQISSGGAFPNLSGRTHLSVFYKVVEPMTTSDGANARLAFKLLDNGAGEDELWQIDGINGVLDAEPGKWHRLLLPLADFTLPNWVAQGNGELNLHTISEIQFQVILGAGEEASGRILFDRFTSYGFQETDFEGPTAVEGFMVAPGDQINTISWNDVAGEEGETYNVYYSLNEITDVAAEGVYSAAIGLAEGTESYEHRIFAPINDQPLTYYYAIQAVDGVGNVGDVTTTGGIENTALGIPTISLDVPSGFTADGDLSEWSHITPFHLNTEGDLGYVPQTQNNYAIDGAADLSADVYVAVDGEALYVAMEVTDDAVVLVPDVNPGDRWLYDGAEFYIGLYNEVSTRHSGFRNSGAELDYKFYFYKQVAFTDNNSDVATHGDGTYFFTETDTGWIVEARFAYDAFEHEGAGDFVPRNGMRIPLDIVIMDNDEINTQNREGILTFSFDNDDNSYQSPRNWGYSWVGDQIVVGVEQISDDLPQQYLLEQNYPNPFNPTTRIRYALPQTSDVELAVYNVLGQKVATLLNTQQTAGTYEVSFDATDLASGLYFYQIRAGSFVEIKKMMLVR